MRCEAGARRALGLLALLAVACAAHAATLAGADYQAVLRSSPDRDAGERLFAACASCHGTDGAGRDEGSIPRIAGQHFKVIAAQLIEYRHGHRWDDRMQAQSSEHRLQDMQAIADVASHVAALDVSSPAATGDGKSLDVGARLYAARCQRCHGASGQGNAEQATPRLAGQRYGYLVRQLHDAVEGRRPNIARSHVRLLDPLEYEQITGVSDYLSRLQ